MRFKIDLIVVALALFTCCPAWGAPKNSVNKNSVRPQSAGKQVPPSPVNILSIMPAQGEPNSSVTLTGTGFTEKSTVFLGSSEVPTRYLGPQQLHFDIPKLLPGLYALFVKREDGVTSKTYNFSLLPPKPRMDTITPDSINICAAGLERVITVTGSNFQPNSQVLFNGAVIKSTFNSSSSLSFAIPQAPGGLHQVQVKNPEDPAATIPFAFSIKSTPEITGVTQGENAVNNYKLIIYGRNFQPGATLSVEEETLQVGYEAVAGKQITAGGPAMGNREQLIFVDCSKLVYLRYPASQVEKGLKLRVTNPGGEISQVLLVSAP